MPYEGRIGERGMDELAYLRPSIFLKFPSSVSAPSPRKSTSSVNDDDAIRARSHCANIQKRNIGPEHAVNPIKCENQDTVGRKWGEGEGTNAPHNL